MRPRAIQKVPGLDPNGTPFERLEQFARHIIAVPKSEVSVDKEIDSGCVKPRAGQKRKKA